MRLEHTGDWGFIFDLLALMITLGTPRHLADIGHRDWVVVTAYLNTMADPDRPVSTLSSDFDGIRDLKLPSPVCPAII